jgi:hypothetical protein
VNSPTLKQGSAKKPNIVVIMGDDIGWFNLGSYDQGIMLGATPNLDRLATQSMRLTDYYAEASCTAGHANFNTGELPIRAGLTLVIRRDEKHVGRPLGGTMRGGHQGTKSFALSLITTANFGERPGAAYHPPWPRHWANPTGQLPPVRRRIA